MTAFAENQLDFHRPEYYSLSVTSFMLSIQRSVYQRIMQCYEQPRMTNEETDRCAAEFRQFMSTRQEELTKSLMTKCVSSYLINTDDIRRCLRLALTHAEGRQIWLA